MIVPKAGANGHDSSVGEYGHQRLFSVKNLFGEAGVT